MSYDAFSVSPNNCCEPCSNCSGEEVTSASGYVGPDKVIRPNICQETEVWWGCFPEGTYQVVFCGGAWYNTGPADNAIIPGVWTSDADAYWICTRIIDGGGGWTTSWGTSTVGWNYDIVYMSAGVEAVAHLPEAEPPVWATGKAGYATEALAAAALVANESTVTLYHSGGKIGIRFADGIYSGSNAGGGAQCGDRSPGGALGTGKTPGFALNPYANTEFSGISAANFCDATYCSCNGQVAYDSAAGFARNRYLMDFYFDAICGHDDVQVTCSATNLSNVRGANFGTGASSANAYFGPFNFASNSTANDVGFWFDLVDEGNKSFSVTLHFSSSDGWSADLVYDVTPVVDEATASATNFCENSCSAPQRVQRGVRLLNGLPALKLDGTCDMTATLVTNANISAITNVDCSGSPLVGTSGPNKCYCSGGAAVGILDFRIDVLGRPSSINFSLVVYVAGTLAGGIGISLTGIDWSCA